MRSILLMLLSFGLYSCSDSINSGELQQFSKTAIFVPEGCSEFVQQEAKKSGFSLEMVEVVYAHPVNRKNTEVAILHYDYVNDAMNFIAYINKNCLPEYELSIPKEKLQNTALQHHIYFGVDPKWIYFKDGEIRILYDKDELGINR